MLEFCGPKEMAALAKAVGLGDRALRRLTIHCEIGSAITMDIEELTNPKHILALCDVLAGNDSARDRMPE